MWSSVSALAIAGAAASTAIPALDVQETFSPSVLALSVNGVSGEPVIMFTDSTGDFYVPCEALAARRIRTGGMQTTVIDGSPHLRVGQAGRIGARLDPATQRLELMVPAELFETTTVSFQPARVRPMTPAKPGFLFNYELLGQYGAGEVALNGAFELGAFAGTSFAQTTATVNWADAGITITRLDSRWTFDDAEDMRSLRIGDAISRGGIGGLPLRFGGVQFGRNFTVQPGFVTSPMPSLNGSAGLPSVVDVYVNDLLVGTRDVQPGPFEVVNTPIVSGNGDVSLVVRDMLGRETVVSESYYNAPGLLREGLHDYSYEIGFLRKNYGRKSFSYGAPIASTTHRYGLSDTLAGEVHAEMSPDVQMAGVGGNLVVPGVGLIGASIAGSRSGAGTGGQLSLSFERQSSGFSLGLLSEFNTADYRSLGVAVDRPRPAKTLQAFLGIPTEFGSLGASYLIRDGRGDDPDVELLGVNASVRIGRLGTLNIAGRRSFGKMGETAVEAFLSVPLGGQTDLSSSVRHDAGGLSAAAALQRSLPFGEGWGYRASIATGEFDRFDGRLQFNTSFGEYGAELSYIDEQVGARVLVAGSIASVEGDVFASRKLEDSFATVSVSGHANVRIYADNHLVARTNENGRAIIPSLRSYDENTIRLEVADLPLDTIVLSSEQVVRPYARSGVGVHFEAPRERSALMHVELAGGEPLPAGASVRIIGEDRSFLSAPGGELYLSGLGASNIVEAKWAGGACRFAFDLPDASGPQPNLGEFTCIPVS